MDLSTHGFGDRILKGLQSRIPRLPVRATKTRIPRGAWILPVALILGMWANRGSREEGRLTWLHENPPRLETWRAELFRRGFGPIDDPAWREKAFAEMPDAGRVRDSALISEDHKTVALRTEGDWLYFGLGMRGNGGQTVKRELWEPLGLGWEAVARFGGLDLPVFQRAAEKARQKQEWRDTRSLNY